jgi:serine/threonine protein kinase
MKNNIFVTRILDVIVVSKVPNRCEKMEAIFMVMEYVANDIKQMIKNVNAAQFEEMHVKIILYNLLCAMNYFHSANLMHRDIKPANLLIDDTCQVKLCDFGQSRTVLLSTKNPSKRLS